MDWKGGAMSGAVYDGSQELGSLMSKVRITDHSTCQELCMTVVRSRTTDLQIRLRIRILLFSSLADKMPIENKFFSTSFAYYFLKVHLHKS